MGDTPELRDFYRTGYLEGIKETQSGWRHSCFFPIIEQLQEDISNMDIFLFGVFCGESTAKWGQLFARLRKYPKRIVCFDSFEGIPPQIGDFTFPEWDPKQSTFFKAFNAMDFWEVDTIQEAIDNFTRLVKPYIPAEVELKIVPGFYSYSLTDDLAKELNPALAIDIDVDIYASAKQALTWVLNHNLYIPNLTLIGYDDWGTPGRFTFSDGESRAHKESLTESNKTATLIKAVGNMEQVIFRINN